MFSGGLRESLDSDVNFRDSIHPEVLELLLDFAYSSRVIINEENAESLLEAGDMLQFHDIRDAAAEFLEKKPALLQLPGDDAAIRRPSV